MGDQLGLSAARTKRPRVVQVLLSAVEIIAATLLLADLLVVIGSVMVRFLFSAPVVWSDDVARLLLLAVVFMGAAAALARGENAGVSFFVERLPSTPRRRIAAVVCLVVLIVSIGLCGYSGTLLISAAGQTVGAGVPRELFILPMCLAAGAMTVFALDDLRNHRLADVGVGLATLIGFAAIWIIWTRIGPEALTDLPVAMGAAFVLSLIAGTPIAFVLGLTSLAFVWGGDVLPGEFFAQQTARGVDNFVLLAVPFFILVGYLMEANGMSVRIMTLLQRGVGRLRGGLDVTMVLSMVVFSGISGSKWPTSPRSARCSCPRPASPDRSRATRWRCWRLPR